jgi:multiple sugar transport system substrate-binding protein
MSRKIRPFSVVLLLVAAVAFPQVTLNYYDYQLTEPEAPTIEAALSQFETANNVTIVRQSVPTAQRGDKLMTLILGGQAPDVGVVVDADLGRFTKANALAPLDAYLKQNADLSSKLMSSLIGVGTINGHVVAIPRFGSVNALVYNATLFKEAGLDPNKPPKTWAEFLDVAKKLTRDVNGDGKIERYGYGLLGAKTLSLHNRYWSWLWNAGGEILTPDNKHSLLGAPAAVEAMKFYTDMALVYKITPSNVLDVDYNALMADFINEKTAMICDGPWQFPRIAKEDPKAELKVAAMPVKTAGMKPYNLGGGGFFSIMSTSKNKDMSWKLVAFMTNVKNNWDYVQQGFLPVRTDTLDMMNQKGTREMKEMAAQVPNGKGIPMIPELPQIGNLLAEEVQFVLLGQKTAADASASLSKRVDDLLAGN